MKMKIIIITLLFWILPNKIFGQNLDSLKYSPEECRQLAHFYLFSPAFYDSTFIHEVLTNSLTDSIYRFSKSTSFGIVVTKLRYIGTAKTINDERYKLLFQRSDVNSSCPNSDDGRTLLIVFNEQNHLIGHYELECVGAQLIDSLSNNKLFFRSPQYDCPFDVITVNDLTKGLPDYLYYSCEGFGFWHFPFVQSGHYGLTEFDVSNYEHEKCFFAFKIRLVNERMKIITKVDEFMFVPNGVEIESYKFENEYHYFRLSKIRECEYQLMLSKNKKSLMLEIKHNGITQNIPTDLGTYIFVDTTITLDYSNIPFLHNAQLTEDYWIKK